MSDQRQEDQKNPSFITNMHKLILFGSGTLLLGTLLLMVTFQAAIEMMMYGRSAGSFVVVIGTAVAIGLLVAGSTIISKWVSRKVQAILEE
ncbi:hypothetical protein [Thalassospira lucentensis]|jgi:hypothetical protein|uniref:hypothetical protein n=1 Tax=Thalassospira lucentensis TaxID=168935 RepID=UPI0003B639B0|nr:hypothetical protein [Thalassospira lucentensis]RCK28948.1 hypothetical protein TH1_07470 [Thalassospira lucentensis MCCC 1A00383 = DSM 14000]